MAQYGTGYGASGDGESTSDYGISQDDYGRAAQDNYGQAVSYDASRGGPPVVSFENVSKRYGNLHAVDVLTLELRPGETVFCHTLSPSYWLGEGVVEQVAPPEVTVAPAHVQTQMPTDAPRATVLRMTMYLRD